MIIKSKKIGFFILLFLLKFSVLAAQSFSIPHFENTNIFHGSNTAPYVTANSILSMKMRFQPSYVCYIDMNIDASIDKLISFFSPVQNPKADGDFSFLGASINFPNINNKLVSVALFTGIYDTLGSDSILQEYLKVKMKEPDFRRYYPTSAFKPQNFIKGSGICIYGAFSSGFYMGLYSYWNEKLKNDLNIKADFRMGGGFDFFYFDCFLGASFPLDITKTKLRAGLSMLFDVDDNYSFFAEAGLAEITTDKATLEYFTSNFYASFEARVKRGFISSNISCFISPVFLLPVGINDPNLKGSFFTGIGADLKFGSIEKNNMEGGLYLMGSLNPLKPALITPFSFLVSPFYTFKVKDIEVDLRLPINPLLYNNLIKMLTGQISIKVVY